MKFSRNYSVFSQKVQRKQFKYVRRVQTPPSLQSEAFGESRPFRYFISDSFDTLMLKNFARSKSLKLICSVSLKPPCSAEEKNYRRFYEIFFTFSCKLSNDLKYRSLIFAIATRYVEKNNSQINCNLPLCLIFGCVENLWSRKPPSDEGGGKNL